MGSSRTVTVLVAAAATALGLAGCSRDPEPDPTPATSVATATASPSTAAPSASPSGTASAPAGFSLDDAVSPTFPDLGGDLGAVGVVRVGRHGGFDRVVWEFPGSGQPTYRVRYVEQPTADGSGDVVAVGGDAFLDVVVSLVGIPDDGTPRPADASAAALSGTVVAEATAIYGGFEGYGQAFVGVHGEQRPFKVTVLRNPTRLVLDISSG